MDFLYCLVCLREILLHKKNQNMEEVQGGHCPCSKIQGGQPTTLPPRCRAPAGQSYHFWRICREYKCFTFARYSPQCESSIIFATPHERPRMLTNTYEYLAVILRSLRLVANCIRKPIRHIFATIWRICREYIFFYIRMYIRHSVRLALGR